MQLFSYSIYNNQYSVTFLPVDDLTIQFHNISGYRSRGIGNSLQVPYGVYREILMCLHI
jgi:hypothetical protein